MYQFWRGYDTGSSCLTGWFSKDSEGSFRQLHLCVVLGVSLFLIPCNALVLGHRGLYGLPSCLRSASCPRAFDAHIEACDAGKHSNADSTSCEVGVS